MTQTPMVFQHWPSVIALIPHVQAVQQLTFLDIIMPCSPPMISGPRDAI